MHYRYKEMINNKDIDLPNHTASYPTTSSSRRIGDVTAFHLFKPIEPNLFKPPISIKIYNETS